MAEDTRRLVNLPGYDTAPDIYETATPDLTADDTTSTTFSPRSASERSDSGTSADEDEEGGGGGVSRRRLRPARARSRFVEGVDGRRRGLRVRGRRSGDGAEEKEGLEARIARLRREVEECRVEAGVDAEDEGEEDLEGLSRILAGIEIPRSSGRGGMKGRPPLERQATPGAWPEAGRGDGTDGDAQQTLSRVADFDSRLAALEQTLGISALDSATSDAVVAPVLPALTALDQQLGALASATSIASLEAASSRIQKLKREAERWAHDPSTAGAATVNGDTQDDNDDARPISQEDITNLQALYALLPTLQSLSPIVPSLLTRLRSLRTLHTSATAAAAELDDVETRQRAMDSELAAWRQGLERVEVAVREADEANGRNGKVVQGWVGELEGRVKGLSR